MLCTRKRRVRIITQCITKCEELRVRVNGFIIVPLQREVMRDDQRTTKGKDFSILTRDCSSELWRLEPIQPTEHGLGRLTATVRPISNARNRCVHHDYQRDCLSLIRLLITKNFIYISKSRRLSVHLVIRKFDRALPLQKNYTGKNQTLANFIAHPYDHLKCF